MQLPSAKNLVRGDYFQQCCDHIFWSNACPNSNTKFPGGTVVFCKTDEVLHFFERLRLTRKRIILITGESDYPCDAFRQQFLPPNVLHWFAPNVTHPHPKVTALPLGLGLPHDPRTLKIESLQATQDPLPPRDQWLYVNFRPETNPTVRSKIYTHFQALAAQEKWITWEEPIPCNGNNTFLNQLKRHHFVLAPPGNGVDTHRLWEALAVGTYPIVWRSPAMEPFANLPILFVDQLEEITLSFLEEHLPLLEAKKANLLMLQMSFWQEKIEASKAALHNHSLMSWHEWCLEAASYGLEMLQRRLP